MTALEKQMAEALPDLVKDTREVFDANGSETPQVVRDVIEYMASWLEVFIQKRFDAQAAEQAAGGGEAVNGTTTGEINGRHDGIRPAVHGRVALGGYTPGALADLLFASDDVMSLNAKLDLTMDQLVPLAQAVLSAISIHPAKAAPSDPQPKVVVAGYVMKGHEFPNQVFYPASHRPTDINNFDAVYFGGAQAPAPAESPAAPVQQVGEREARYSTEELLKLAKDRGPFFDGNARQALKWAAWTLEAADIAVKSEHQRAEAALAALSTRAQPLSPDAFDIAIREAWQMIDLMRPPPAGTYALGEHNGIAAALKTVRENYERALAARGEKR